MSVINVDKLGPVQIEALGRLSAEALNTAVTAKVVMTTEGFTNIYDAFNEGGAARPFDASVGAKNAVDFYRLTYNTTLPETQQIDQVSGLLAIPVGQQRSRRPKTLPLLSWQHGTIFSADQAPSALVSQGAIARDAFGAPLSSETLFNVVRFAGNGYAIAAADYVGNGLSTKNQAYAIKDATIQTTQDMITGAVAAIQRLVPSKLSNPVSGLFLNGWSQGGMNTQWLGSALQNDGIIVHKQAQSASPSDLQKTFSYWLNDFQGVPNSLTVTIPLLLGAYETYYGIKGLMSAAIKSDYLDTSNRIYNQQVDWTNIPTPQEGEGLLGLPLTPKAMVNSSFLEEFNAGKGDFYKQIKANNALEQRFNWPTRFYGGTGDNVVPPPFSITLPVEFQQSLGSTTSIGVDAGANGSHRSTFLSSLFGLSTNPSDNILSWFNTP